MTEEVKVNSVLVFCEGTLTIKRSGYKGVNGGATLSVPEEQLAYEDGHAIFEIAPSELRELRNFIDKELALNGRQRGEP